MELKNLAEKSLAELKKAGSQKSLVSVSRTTAKEFNVEASQLTLLRTTFDQNLSMKAMLDQKTARTSGNQFSDESVQSLAQEATSSAKASPADEANGFAPSQGAKNFQFGLSAGNDEWMYSQLSNILKEVKEKFPKTILEGANLKFVQNENILATSDGTLFSGNQGFYEGFVMFTTKDGKKVLRLTTPAFICKVKTHRPHHAVCCKLRGWKNYCANHRNKSKLKKFPQNLKATSS